MNSATMHTPSPELKRTRFHFLGLRCDNSQCPPPLPLTPFLLSPLLPKLKPGSGRSTTGRGGARAVRSNQRFDKNMFFSGPSALLNPESPKL